MGDADRMIQELRQDKQTMKEEHEKALQNKEEDVMKMLANTLKDDGETITRYKYVGQMNLLNQPHGKGLMTLDDGSTYDGDYKSGKAEYSGIFTWGNGNKYVGEIEKREGHGVYTWADGDKYDGEWKNNKMEGHGIYTWANGKKYVGEYKKVKEKVMVLYTTKM